MCYNYLGWDALGGDDSGDNRTVLCLGGSGSGGVRVAGQHQAGSPTHYHHRADVYTTQGELREC